MAYAVWCQVWGGVTGHREAWNKGKDGKVELFETLEAAQARAAACTELTMGDFHRVANFRYTAMEYDQ
jgi:hypothetical protein